MKTMINYAFVGALGLSVMVVACGDDDETTTTTTTTTTTSSAGGATTSSSSVGGSGGGGGMPMVPTLGTQVDRKGRPAINTAGNETFTADANRGASEDAYNASGDTSTWATSFVPVVTDTLAVLDSLDDTCENQLLYGLDATLQPLGTCPGAGNDACYGALATLLTNDWLIIKGDAVDRGLAGSTEYLAVEANAAGALTNDQAGGRTPAMDVILRSYSVLAAGALTGVDDTITAGASAQVTAFPFLAAPN